LIRRGRILARSGTNPASSFTSLKSMYPIFSTVNLQTRLRRTKNFFLTGLRTGAAIVFLLILPASLGTGVAGRLGRRHGGGSGGRTGIWRFGRLGARAARLRVARHLQAVLDLLVDPHGEEPQDVFREPHLALHLGDARRGRPEQEVVVRRLGPFLDGVGEAAASHRLVLLDRRAVVDEELAELVDDGEGSRLVLFGDDEKDHVVLALRVWGGHGVSSFWIAPVFAGREARLWTTGPVPGQGCGSPARRRTGVENQLAGSSSGERLKRFMAASIPSVTNTVRASHADAGDSSTAGRSFFEKRESTYVSSASPGWKFSPRTPRRRRGENFQPGEALDTYVLSRFSKKERPAVDEATASACEALTVFVTEGIDAAMNRFNRSPEEDPAS